MTTMTRPVPLDLLSIREACRVTHLPKEVLLEAARLHEIPVYDFVSRAGRLSPYRSHPRPSHSLLATISAAQSSQRWSRRHPQLVDPTCSEYGPRIWPTLYDGYRCPEIPVFAPEMPLAVDHFVSVPSG
jgi:hypothetical protein